MHKNILLVAAALLGTLPAVYAQQPAEAGTPKQEAEKKVLMVGDPAPALAVEKWVKGSPVAKLESGKVYMVEFWATWCGPCIKGMPHLTELQKKYKDQGLTIIGVSSKDSRGNSLESVEKMVAEKGDVMGYTVAWDTERKTNAAFFEAAGQRGIPCAFLVDQNGKIAYIGHPMSIDKTLDDVMAKKHDIKKLADEYKASRLAEEKAEAVQEALGKAYEAEDWDTVLAKFDELIALDKQYASAALSKFDVLLTKKKDLDKAYALGAEIMDGVAKDNPQMLNGLAWIITSPENDIARRDLDLAFKAITRANELEKGKEPRVLDTLARVHFLKGDAAKAVEIQTQAVGLADARLKPDLEKALEEYKAAAAGKKTGG